MAEPKTTRTGASVAQFLDSACDGQRRTEAQSILEMIEDVVGEKAEMWGPSIVGVGTWKYKDSRGKVVEWPVTGFSPRKAAFVVYITLGVESFPEIASRLGKYTNGRSCLYFKKLADIDPKVLAELVRVSVAAARDYQAKELGDNS